MSLCLGEYDLPRTKPKVGNLSTGARRRDGGKMPPPKNVMEKWFDFPEMYKTTKVLEDGIENWEK